MTPSRCLTTYKKYTIGWIAALDRELTAALAMLDEQHQQPEDFEKNAKDSNSYLWGEISGHNIVIASLGGGNYGLVSAATTAACMVNSLPHLRFGLMVGIGAGVPGLENDDIRLGDVVVSVPKGQHPGVVQYDSGKLKENGHLERVGSLAPPPTILLKGLDVLRANERLKGSELPEILAKAIQRWPNLGRAKGKDSAYIHQGTQNDRLFESASIHVPIDSLGAPIRQSRASNTFSLLLYHSLQLPLVCIWYLLCFFCASSSNIGSSETGKISPKTRPPEAISLKIISETQACAHCEREIHRPKRLTEEPEVHYGTIASGNLVVKDGIFRDQISQKLGTNVLCYEMEAAGLMNDFPCLVVRGICDYADSHKNDRWQNYAAIVAAAYAKQLLGVLDATSVERSEGMEEIMTEVSQSTFRIEKHTEAVRQGVQGLTDVERTGRMAHWLSAPDPSRNHNDAFRLRSADTGRWFIQSEEYQRWGMTPASCLWLWGMPGCGKTVLSSVVINNLGRRETGTDHLLFFYFTFTDVGKQSLDGLMRSLIDQLRSKSTAAQRHVSAVFDDHGHGATQPSTKTLCETFEYLVKLSGMVWVVLDALDEGQLGNNAANEGLLLWLKCLMNRKYVNLRIIVTSRRVRRIQMILDELVPRESRICLESDMINHDIRTYVDTTIAEWSALEDWEERVWVKREIRDYLTKNAHGMFRWVACQLQALEHLSGCRDYAVLKETLELLPPTLDETYARILSKIPDAIRERALRILQFLIFSEAPLNIQEAREITLVYPKAERSKRRMDKLKERDLDAVLIYCPNLIKSTGEGNNFLQLSHFSVKEYLLSKRSGEQISLVFEEQVAKASMAEICLAYLLEITHSLSYYHSEPSYPLAGHSARFWVRYACQAGNNMNLGLVQEFVGDKNCHQRYHSIGQETYFGYQPEGYRFLMYPHFAMPQIERYRPEPESLLHHFAHHGLMCGVEEILRVDIDAVNVQGGDFGNALQAASSRGYNEIVKELLKHGANIDADGGYHGNALQASVYEGHSEVVQELLNHGANVNIRGGFFGNALQAAAFQGHNEIMTQLLRSGADVNAEGGHFGTALAAAVHESREETIYILLDHNANINGHEHGHEDLLFNALRRGEHRLARILLDKNIIVSRKAFNIAYGERNMALISLMLRNIPNAEKAGYCSQYFQQACEEGDEEFIQTLIRSKIDIGKSPYNSGLHAAARMGQTSIVALFLEEGAPFNEEETLNLDPLYAANGRVDVMRLLLEEDEDPLFFEETLEDCSYKGCVDAVTLLLQTLVDNHQIENKLDALTDALVKATSQFSAEHCKIVEMLLENGADPDAPVQHRGNMLCHVSREWKNAENRPAVRRVIELLVEYGADLDRGHKPAHCAVDTALWSECWEIADIFVEKGATKTHNYKVIEKERLREQELQEAEPVEEDPIKQEDSGDEYE